MSTINVTYSTPNSVEVATQTNTVTIVQPGGSSVTVNQTGTQTVEITAPGPQGPAGQISNTGSFATTGSNTFIGTQIITGSLNISAGITGSLLGSASFAQTASYALNIPVIDLGPYLTTASFNQFTVSYNTGSFTGSFTGSILGSASFAQTASYALNVPVIDLTPYATTESFNAFSSSINSFTQSILSWTSSVVTNSVFNQFTASYNTGSFSGSLKGTADTASYYAETDPIYTAEKGKYLTTGSFGVGQTIEGSLTINQNLTVLGSQSVQHVTSSQLNISTNIISVNTASPPVRFGGLAVYDSGSTGTGLTGSILWDSLHNVWIYTNPSGSVYDGAMILVGPRNNGGIGNEVGINSWYAAVGNGSHHMTSSLIWNSGSLIRLETDTEVLGGLDVSGGITGSLLGTASWAESASVAITAQTAVLAPNYVPTSVTASMLQPYVLTTSTASMLQPYVLTTSTASMLQPYVLTTSTASMLQPYVLTTSTASMLQPYVLTASTASMLQPYVLTSQTSSMTVATASWANNVLASGVVGLNLSQIATGSVTASVTPSGFSVVSGSMTEFVVTGTGVTIGAAATDTHSVTGSLGIQGLTSQSPFQIASGSTSLLFVSSSGNIGIGTSTPTARLNISSSITGSSNVGLINLEQTWNTTGAPTAFRMNITDTASSGASNLMSIMRNGSSLFSINRDGLVSISQDLALNNTVIYWPSSNQIRNTSNGILRFSAAAGGAMTRVQFGGTTSASPALGMSGSALCVVDAAGTTSTNLLVGTTTDAGFKLDVNGNTRITGSLTVTGSTAIQDPTSQSPFQISSGSTSLLFVSSSGNIGIGTNTPSSSLEIRKDGITNVLSDANGLVLSNTVAGTAGVQTQNAPYITFVSNQWEGFNATNYTNRWRIRANNTDGSSGTQITSNLLFDLNKQGGGYTNVLTLNSDEYGTTSATVAGSLTATSGLVASGNGASITHANLNNFTNALTVNATTSHTDGGVRNGISLTSNFTVASTTSSYNSILLTTGVNQTGTATGITRGLFINPTLTSAADFRAIEVNSGSLVMSDSYLASGSRSGSLVNLTHITNTAGNVTSFLLNASGSAGASSNLMELQAGGTPLFRVSRAGIVSANDMRADAFAANNASTGFELRFRGNAPITSYGVQINSALNSNNLTSTTGTFSILAIDNTNFIPTTGNANLNAILVAPTISQSAAVISSGSITRGLFINPTLTSAADFRAIETTRGRIIFSSAQFTGSVSQSSYFTITGSMNQPATTGSQIYAATVAPLITYTAPSQTNTAFRVLPTFTGSAALTASQQNIIADFGASSVGSQFVVNDITSGSIYQVNDVSGLPIIEATSNWDVNIYDFPTTVFRKTGTSIIMSASLAIVTGSGVEFAVTNTGVKIGNVSTDLHQVTGSITMATGSITVTSGSVTMPNRPAFRVYGNGTINNLSTTTNGDGTLNSNNFATDYQQGTGFNASTGIFTAPIAGLYDVHMICRNDGNANFSQLAVLKNNSNTAPNVIAMVEFAGNSTMNHAGASSIARLAVGDTLRLKVLANTITFDGNDSWAVAYIG